MLRRRHFPNRLDGCGRTQRSDSHSCRFCTSFCPMSSLRSRRRFRRQCSSAPLRPFALRHPGTDRTRTTLAGTRCTANTFSERWIAPRRRGTPPYQRPLHRQQCASLAGAQEQAWTQANLSRLACGPWTRETIVAPPLLTPLLQAFTGEDPAALVKSFRGMYSLSEESLSAGDGYGV